jgi:hypothetical protein
VSDRKPTGASWESWVERQIRTGVEQGAFDRLPGSGRPLPFDEGPHDEGWWLKAKLRREELNGLPSALRVRKELEVARAAIARARTEEAVRVIVAEINTQIRDLNRLGAEGPPSTLLPLDVEAVVECWRSS